MTESLAVGLVGAGPWATMFHAPVLGAGPQTRLAAVWARRPEAAASLATAHGAVACTRYEELLDRCEAVAFAVPPDVQVPLAVTAAAAGKTLLLEKPLAGHLGAARRLAGAVGEAGVGSLVLFTARFSEGVATFLDEVVGGPWTSGRCWYLSGAFLDGPFSSSPWRHERGALLDVGPHAIDLATAALGPAVEVRATRSPGGWDAAQLRHESGAVSELSLSCSTASAGGAGIELRDRDRVTTLDVHAAMGVGDLGANIRSALVDAAAGRPHPCDVHRGLVIQELLDAAERQVRS